MKKVDILQNELQLHSEEALQKGIPYILTMRAFSDVVSACFGMSLVVSYKEYIAEFKRLYMSLDITVTPKVIISLGLPI